LAAISLTERDIPASSKRLSECRRSADHETALFFSNSLSALLKKLLRDT